MAGLAGVGATALHWGLGWDGGKEGGACIGEGPSKAGSCREILLGATGCRLESRMEHDRCGCRLSHLPFSRLLSGGALMGVERDGPVFLRRLSFSVLVCSNEDQRSSSLSSALCIEVSVSLCPRWVCSGDPSLPLVTVVW